MRQNGIVEYSEAPHVEPVRVDMSGYKNRLGLKNKVGRMLWGFVWVILFLPSPRLFFWWRRWLLRVFGAKVGKKAIVRRTCRIWAPWNLTMGDFSCLGPYVDCYCVDKIHIGNNATVSQYCYLCTASHDIEDPHMELVTAPIFIGNGAWVCADAFIGPGVTLGEGAVAAARAVVVKDVDSWMVVGGNPAKVIKRRELTQSGRGRTE